MADPFAFLTANLMGPVRIEVLGGDVISGTLISMDDTTNVLVKDWRHVRTGSEAAGSPPPMKRSKPERATEVNSSIRFIRGSQIKAMRLSAAPAV